MSSDRIMYGSIGAGILAGLIMLALFGWITLYGWFAAGIAAGLASRGSARGFLAGLISGAILSVLAIVLALFVPASTLGTAKGALDKAIDYVKVRKTFERPLKDYGPVANGLSKLMAEYLALSQFMDSVDEKDERGRLSLKTLSVDFAKRATKAALQYHGGYGYIEDTGVEKFYRDAMGLSILFQRPHHDSMRLSKEIFGEKSGYL